MPFVRIFVAPGYSADQRAAIGGGVHEAMVETIDVPVEDRFQVITQHAEDEMIWSRTFLDVARSERAVFIQITLSAGRSDDKKRALYAAIVRNLAPAGIRPEDVLIVLTENIRANWSFGNGIAHYAPAG